MACCNNRVNFFGNMCGGNCTWILILILVLVCCCGDNNSNDCGCGCD